MENISLAQQLEDYKAASIKKSAPERTAMMEGATADLKASGIELRALQSGVSAPGVSLLDMKGHKVNLSDLWQKETLVVVFYRGGWCPYCNLELRAWQTHLESLKQLGAGLIAISPQTADNSLSTAEKNQLKFTVLSDTHLEAAKAFGIAFEMPENLIDLYKSFGNDLSVVNGNGRWVLPLPATYVIGRDDKIIYAHVEADYRMRAEPADVLARIKVQNEQA
jgi:peroxiredoxin